MLSREEREDLLDASYQEALRRDFEAVRSANAKERRRPPDLGEILDWLTFMSELFEDRRPRETRESPDRMLL